MNTKNKADELGLIGWVKNTPNGEVEVLAEGKEGDLTPFQNLQDGIIEINNPMQLKWYISADNITNFGTGLKEFIKWCYNGSKGAEVDKVDVEWGDVVEKEFGNFEVIL